MLSELISLLTEGMLLFSLHLSGSSFPHPLSAKEEHDCFDLMKDGDFEARDKLIRHNLRLVAHVIKKYYSSQNDQDDMISIGTIGLIKAVNTFNYCKGARFATYAARCIENAMVS
ncbi:MAG: sigma-70 family RNA polymerase sigma factor [Oscillospiraceae bacterium]